MCSWSDYGIRHARAASIVARSDRGGPCRRSEKAVLCRRQTLGQKRTTTPRWFFAAAARGAYHYTNARHHGAGNLRAFPGIVIVLGSLHHQYLRTRVRRFTFLQRVLSHFVVLITQCFSLFFSAICAGNVGKRMHFFRLFSTRSNVHTTTYGCACPFDEESTG